MTRYRSESGPNIHHDGGGGDGEGGSERKKERERCILYPLTALMRALLPQIDQVQSCFRGEDVDAGRGRVPT